MIDNRELKIQDPEVYAAVEGEAKRQRETIELIASENFVSNAVREASGSVLTNKYAEGYPGKRYYGGCEFVDQAESIAIERAKKLFGCAYANVQPHSGSSANMAAIRSMVSPGCAILGMSLDAGGHLSHGYHLSFSGKDYESYFYGVNPETGLLDYDEILRIAKEIKPALIVCGASAYPRLIDFAAFRRIADEVGAYLMADIAHIAGMVAVGLHPSPIGYAHVVTSTTHKTLRGPRGGLILTNNEVLAKRIDRTVFPEIQGGPLEQTVAAKAVAFGEALQPEFKTYISAVLANAKALAESLKEEGVPLVSNGTDNHLLLADVKAGMGVTGLQAQTVLESCHITANKNSIPNDTEKPAYCSGIRLGTPAMTTRGFSEEDFKKVGKLIAKALRRIDDEAVLEEVREAALALARSHPLPYEE